MKNKLKTLALILRSLPPQSQKSLFEQLPTELVQRINGVKLLEEHELTQEDWDNFARSWPEFSMLIESVKKESTDQRYFDLAKTERPKIIEYLEYRMGHKKDRPNLSGAIARIVDKTAVE